jgi:hypothetical protein
MFTIKLYKGHSVKIVSGSQIDVYPAAQGQDENQKNDVREIFVKGLGGVIDGPQDAFYVADPRKQRPSGWAEEVVFYDRAIIENQHGATTEVVRSY